MNNPEKPLPRTPDGPEKQGQRLEPSPPDREICLQLPMDSIPRPIWCSDARGQVIQCNRRWYEYTGQTPDEAKGDGWMKVVHPDDLERVASFVREAVAGGELHEAEYRLRRTSDEQLPLAFGSSRSRARQGRKSWLLVRHRDRHPRP